MKHSGTETPAILMNTPGTPDAMITTLDGHPLALKGKSGKALKMAHLSSVTGDTFSDIVNFKAGTIFTIKSGRTSCNYFLFNLRYGWVDWR